MVGLDPGVQHADDHALAEVGLVPYAGAPQTQELRRASRLQRDELVAVCGEEPFLLLHRRQVIAGQPSGEAADDVLVGVEEPLFPGVNGMDRQERPVIGFPDLRIPVKMKRRRQNVDDISPQPASRRRPAGQSDLFRVSGGGETRKEEEDGKMKKEDRHAREHPRSHSRRKLRIVGEGLVEIKTVFWHHENAG